MFLDINTDEIKSTMMMEDTYTFYKDESNTRMMAGAGPRKIRHENIAGPAPGYVLIIFQTYKMSAFKIK